MTTWAPHRTGSLAIAIALVVILAAAASPAGQIVTDVSRVPAIVAELNPLRRAWTICTVDEIGRAVGPGRTAEAMADRALARCADREHALRAKAAERLGAEAADRLMERLVPEARAALVESARTLKAAGVAGNFTEPVWPLVLKDAH